MPFANFPYIDPMLLKPAKIEQREFHDAYGVSIVTIEADEPTIIEQHQHDHDHLSYVAAGSVRPIVEGEELPVLKAGDTMLVKAFKTHLFQTLEPNTRILCITNTLGAQSEKDRRVPTAEPRVLPKEFGYNDD